MSKHSIGDLIYGFQSGLGIIVDIQYRQQGIADVPQLMYLVKHFYVDDSMWHVESGIDKMKKMYENKMSGKSVGEMFDRLVNGKD